MKKRLIALLCAVSAMAVLVTGCATVRINIIGVPASKQDQVENEADDEELVKEDDVTIRVGGLKGPTSIGLLGLKADAANGKTVQDYDFVMATAADEITTALVKGELDIALIPANVSSVLYNKTEGKISVIDINTLGVLYMVSGDSDIDDVADLKDKTIYLTGKGTTPDYVLQYILSENDMTGDVTLEYKSEATEVAAILAQDDTAKGLLPQPFVTAACMQNDKLSVVIDMTEEWDKLQSEGGSRLVTGVTVVRNEFLSEHEEAVKTFIQEHAASVEKVNEDIEGSALLAVTEGIIAKEPIAMKAIPNCNIVCITGDEMKEALSGYLGVLYGLDPKSVGGKLPDEGFYYKAQ